MRYRLTSLGAAVAVAGSVIACAPAAASAQAGAGALAAPPRQCEPLKNGTVCITLLQSPQRIRVTYNKTGGSPVTARVGYRSNQTSTVKWDSTWYTVFAGQSMTRTWNVSYPCDRKWIGALQINDGRTFETAGADC
ncbi:hypothetical protein [Nonomuraea sp. KM88]|uniref:hypothetical protein n=1 Tax=Nonomuraea sp. KM88 TaxID=3457427 RepID=UPI003FCCBA40